MRWCRIALWTVDAGVSDALTQAAGRVLGFASPARSPRMGRLHGQRNARGRGLGRLYAPGDPATASSAYGVLRLPGRRGCQGETRGLPRPRSEGGLGRKKTRVPPRLFPPLGALDWLPPLDWTQLTCAGLTSRWRVVRCSRSRPWRPGPAHFRPRPISPAAGCLGSTRRTPRSWPGSRPYRLGTPCI